VFGDQVLEEAAVTIAQHGGNGGHAAGSSPWSSPMALMPSERHCIGAA
jgi:hypothetical protein